MCGRFTLTTPVFSWLLELFPERFANGKILPVDTVRSDMAKPRYNIAPTQPILVLRTEGQGEFRLDEMRWGLVPAWSDDLAIGAKMINARSETIAEKPSFKPLLPDKRCVVLADGYYEWKTMGAKAKQPYWIHRPGQQHFAMAGLWCENRRIPVNASGLNLQSATIITTSSNDDTSAVHDRMPAVLFDASAILRWLMMDWKQEANQAGLLSLLRPAPAGSFQLRRVSQEVGKPQNDFRALIDLLSD